MMRRRKGGNRLGIRLGNLLLLSFTVLFTLGGCAWIQEWINPFPSKLINEEEAERICNIQNAAGELYDTLSRQGEPAAAQQVITWLSNQEVVQNCGLSGDGSIWIEYECGMEGLLLVPYDITVRTFTSSVSSGLDTPLNRRVELMPPSALTSTSSRVGILLPFLFNGVSERIGNKVQEAILRSGYREDQIDVYKGPNVTLDIMRQIGSYGIIFMITHGGISRFNQWLFTGEKVTAKKLVTEWATSFGIGIGWVKGELFFMVNSRFIRDLRFPGSLVFLNACHSLKREDLANAFLESGAKVYFGWSDMTFAQENMFVGRVSSVIFDLLSYPGVTVTEAYNARVIQLQGSDYSINDLYPVTLYQDEDGDKLINVCYAAGPCVGGEDEWTEWYRLDFTYKGNGNLVLNPLRTVFVESQNYLYVVDPAPDGADTLVGLIETAEGHKPSVTDIAWDTVNKQLLAVSFERLYRLNPSTAKAYPIGAGLGLDNVNALAFDATGQLFAATIDGRFLQVEPSTGQVTRIGSYGNSFGSSGDLAFRSDGSLFATVFSPGRSSDILVQVDPATGVATEIGEIGYADVFGLFFVEDHLYGVTAGSDLISINTETGEGSLIRKLTFSAWGAQSLGD